MASAIKPVSVLDQQVPEIRQPRFGPLRFSIQPRIWVGLRRVRLVRSRLATEIAPILVRAAVLPLKTLLTRPRFDQRPVDREVFVGHQPCGTVDHAPEETPRDVLIQQTVSVLAEDRGYPHGFIHVHADEPPEQQVVIQLLHQQALAADGVEDLQQLRPQQPLGRNRRPPDAGIQAVELARHVTQHVVDQRPDGTQRVIGGHALLGRHVTEHRIGLTVVSSHRRHRSTPPTICRSPAIRGFSSSS